MRISSPAPRKQTESILPMINVVFLLLIFFLITAQLRASDPAEVEPPRMAEGDIPKDGPAVVFLDAAGTVYFRDATGEQAYAALGAGDQMERIQLRVDARTSAPVLARVMRRLAESGGLQVDIVVRPE